MSSLRETVRNLGIRILGRLRSPPLDGSDPVYRFLTYHRIRADQRLAFTGQLDRLRERFHVVSPGEFESGAGRTDCVNLVLTFDDGFLEWETIVLRALDRRDLQALFFVSPDFVGTRGREAERYCREHLGIEPAPPVTTSGLERIRSAGHTIGNHLLEHRDLRRCRDPSTLRGVFEKSQRVFRDRFALEPRWVAYPFADFFRAPGAVADSAADHFDYGVSLVPGWNRPGEDHLLLHRDGFSPDLPASVEAAWVLGGYDPLFRLTHVLK